VQSIDVSGEVVAASEVAAVQVIEAETAIITPTLELPDDELTVGEVILSGTGEPETEVEVVVDGQVAGTATVDSAGQWTLPIELPDAGDYQAHVQSVDTSGQVVAASEEIELTVIEEEAAEAPTAPSEEGGQAYIVQLDDWLSKLADKFYGDMFAYPTIVEATNAKAKEDSSFTVITNPDLIEIGQKLWIPAAAAP
jgi:nucleoid-associated protein YgaU